MTPKSLLFLLLFVYSSNGFAQGIMTYKDGKQYQATNSWDFISQNYALTGLAKIQIAKADKGGVLQISVETTDASFYIGGTIYVDLEDHTVLVCTDKNLRKTAAGSTTAWYIFSPAEMNRLKKTNISGIRFYIKGKQKKFSSQTGSFTALNKKAYFNASGKEPEKFETAAEVHSLYQ